MSKPTVGIHDGNDPDHYCNTFYDGDVCIRGKANCVTMSDEEALALALDLIDVVRKRNNNL